ncbi:hypothetical protein DFP72DRAFT_846976 [Ephemerocybe angulata]|uniref:Uncharacterized protein n=1 Tax=Ephemerocybe angulata TaxID=980116 RepID=A0A8H6M653_9AGAR|nr:hypothetical protein DFP72DRAFT_846976 [Tulosesus angulatus]
MCIQTFNATLVSGHKSFSDPELTRDIRDARDDEVADGNSIHTDIAVERKFHQYSSTPSIHSSLEYVLSSNSFANLARLIHFHIDFAMPGYTQHRRSTVVDSKLTVAAHVGAPGWTHNTIKTVVTTPWRGASDRDTLNLHHASRRTPIIPYPLPYSPKPHPSSPLLPDIRHRQSAAPPPKSASHVRLAPSPIETHLGRWEQPTETKSLATRHLAPLRLTLPAATGPSRGNAIHTIKANSGISNVTITSSHLAKTSSVILPTEGWHLWFRSSQPARAYGIPISTSHPAPQRNTIHIVKRHIQPYHHLLAAPRCHARVRSPRRGHRTYVVKFNDSVPSYGCTPFRTGSPSPPWISVSSRHT